MPLIYWDRYWSFGNKNQVRHSHWQQHTFLLAALSSWHSRATIALKHIHHKKKSVIIKRICIQCIGRLLTFWQLKLGSFPSSTIARRHFSSVIKSAFTRHKSNQDIFVVKKCNHNSARMYLQCIENDIDLSGNSSHAHPSYWQQRTIILTALSSQPSWATEAPTYIPLKKEGRDHNSMWLIST